MKLKEMPFGTPVDDPDGYCIYTSGHVDSVEFLVAVKSMTSSEVPEDARAALTVDDVEHVRFRNMSPTEARANGLSSGVLQVDSGGYAVTSVKL